MSALEKFGIDKCRYCLSGNIRLFPLDDGILKHPLDDVCECLDCGQSWQPGIDNIRDLRIKLALAEEALVELSQNYDQTLIARTLEKIRSNNGQSE